MGLSLLDPFAEHPAEILAAAEVAQVVSELNRLLASHHFHTSKRCQAFLRYVVAETLAGRHELKERTIGIEVFDRSPSYDTSLDPVVRMTAGEVRKRLALSYQEIAGPSGLRIELPVGSYIPRFQFLALNGKEGKPENVDLSASEADTFSLDPRESPSNLSSAPMASEDVAVEALPSLSHPPSPTRLPSRLLKASAAIGLALLVAGGLAVLRFHRDTPRPAPVQPTPIQELWSPFLATAEPVLISIGQIRPAFAEVEPNEVRSSVRGPIGLNNRNGFSRIIAVTVLGDSIAMTDIASTLKAAGKQVVIHPESTTSFADLQQGPVVLVGAFDNDWTMMLTDPLRFHFSIDDSKRVTWIADREHPETRIGTVVTGTSTFTMKSDYAVVVRMYEPRTRQIVCIAAGLTPFGTQAAGQFLTDPASIAELVRRAPPDWSSKNMEMLLRTDLIDNEAGPPVIVNSTFW